ncbi:hypothetical protein OV203_07730 [Nannocystis sp. ILAH1]|uniref:hypothetical protein n=1 Tax=Nannocystis sp. ILAH1 TaxID=2996789 RepID=UPI00226D8AE4|nr:hypothetical protein [Nannocystis sp. ILAH1]MCY0987007.1 hypothetical protein [Nannocystis sp. ILAH1]
MAGPIYGPKRAPRNSVPGRRSPRAVAAAAASRAPVGAQTATTAGAFRQFIARQAPSTNSVRRTWGELIRCLIARPLLHLVSRKAAALASDRSRHRLETGARMAVALLCACSGNARSPGHSPTASSTHELPAGDLPPCSRPAHLLPANPPALADPSVAFHDSGLAAEVSHYPSSRLYPGESGPPLPPAHVGVLDDFWWGEPWVLNPGTESGGQRRVQFACDRETYRVGFWMDAKDLRPTNRSETLLVARPELPRQSHERLPGVRIPAGSALLLAPVGDGAATAAVYDDQELVRAEGYIASTVVDVVYKPAEQRPETIAFDGSLTGATVVVRDAPRGAELARLSLREPLAVTQLERRGDAVLVRAHRSGATVVGWVDGVQFDPRPRWTEQRQPKGGGGGAEIVGKHPIELAAGTLLVHEDSGQTLGVVTRTGTFSCVGPCEAQRPKVMIVCGYELRLRALPLDCSQ